MIYAPETEEEKRILEKFLAKPPRLKKRPASEIAANATPVQNIAPPTLVLPSNNAIVAAPTIIPQQEIFIPTILLSSETPKEQEQQHRKRKRNPSKPKSNKRAKVQPQQAEAPSQETTSAVSVFSLLQTVTEKQQQEQVQPQATTNQVKLPRVKKRKQTNKAHYESNMPVCTFYLQGKCAKGEACIFKHEGEPISHKNEICKFFLAGACSKGEECVFGHDTALFPCKFYFVLHSCTKGSECKFSHQEPTPEQWEILKKVDKQHRESKEALQTEEKEETKQDSTSTEADVLFDPFATHLQVPATVASYMPTSPPAPVTTIVTNTEPQFSLGSIFGK